MKFACVCLSLCAIEQVLVQYSEATQPNPPSWPSTVQVFGLETPASDIQQKVDAAYSVNGGQPDNGQFSQQRFAFLFKPGTYTVDVPVGYYTQVSGLGKNPADVKFTSSKGVYCEEGSYVVGTGALNTFWRAADNFQTDADFAWNSNGHKGMIWAASQASTLRRIIVSNDLDLYQYVYPDSAAGYASGGYLSNSVVKGTIGSGSQQQYISRNNEVGKWSDGVWNMVFVGTQGAPESHCGADPAEGTHPYVTVESAPTIAEKPFISIDDSNKYSLCIPRVSQSRTGVDYQFDQVGFEGVYVASASDSSATINEKLNDGLHIVLAPGVYYLESPLELNHANQVLLGLGLATLVATKGTELVRVGNVDGVRVAGILLEAGSTESPSLLQWGDATNKYAGSASNPGVMSDIYARVGGPKSPDPAKATVMLRISSSNVIVDNSWLWRADHVEGGGLVKNSDNPCEVAAIIDGDDVVVYGFKAEHALTDQIQWNGNGGKTFMFQSELPYDVTQANFGDKGYAGYRVGEQVETHQAYGVGVYHYFRDYAVTVKSAIVAPSHLEGSFLSPLAVFLNGQGVIEHILNDKGDQSSKDTNNPSAAVAKWWCSGNTPPSPPPPSPPSPPSPPPSPPSPPAPTCSPGDHVTCPGTTVGCAGDQCCPDGSTCPSAYDTFNGCPMSKTTDCTKQFLNFHV